MGCLKSEVAESDAANTTKVLSAKAFGTEIWSEKDTKL